MRNIFTIGQCPPIPNVCKEGPWEIFLMLENDTAKTILMTAPKITFITVDTSFLVCFFFFFCYALEGMAYEKANGI